MGGEHVPILIDAESTIGSSPHGRGTRHAHARRCAADRFIPAWAGNTRSGSGSWRERTVHPRMGGEHPLERPHVSPAVRFIPAWAGNTDHRPWCCRTPTVHPRMGGEHGDHRDAVVTYVGSSPHGRGTRRPDHVLHDLHRFIPAWAGNTGPGDVGDSRIAVHPRMGGEHGTPIGTVWSAIGSSPHGRGTPPDALDGDRGVRFIPAWAGNTRRWARDSRSMTVHPRMGGEHTPEPPRAEHPDGSSPHGRGTRRTGTRTRWHTRFIPAWAGNTTGCARVRKCQPVHPRMGGEHTPGSSAPFP